MEHKNIEPHKVTKPIQLLAAWLAGLVLVNGTFLGAAMAFDNGSGERFYLTVAAIINVPLFLGAIFLLQTKFRPELQEDSYYSSYLDKKTQKVTEVNPIDDLRMTLNSLRRDVSALTVKSQALELEETVASDISVSLSEKAPDVVAFKKKLKRLNIGVIKMFDPEAAGNKTDRFHVVLNPDLPFGIKVEMLKLAAEYGLDSYSYDRPDSVNTEDIYIGGFGYKVSHFLVTQDFTQLVKSNPTQHALRQYEEEHESEGS